MSAARLAPDASSTARTAIDRLVIRVSLEYAAAVDFEDPGAVVGPERIVVVVAEVVERGEVHADLPPPDRIPGAGHRVEVRRPAVRAVDVAELVADPFAAPLEEQ